MVTQPGQWWQEWVAKPQWDGMLSDMGRPDNREVTVWVRSLMDTEVIHNVLHTTHLSWQRLPVYQAAWVAMVVGGRRGSGGVKPGCGGAVEVTLVEGVTCKL